MFDAVVLLSQTTMLALIAGWLTTGVRDNILYPDQNETFTAEVLTMSRLKAEFPEFYDQIAHRAISNRTGQLALFRIAVFCELAVTVVLWASVVAMILALLGGIDPETAKILSILGATGFTAIWAGFLVVGNHFAYWFGHDDAQNTHYQMTHWGIGVLIFLCLT